MVSAATAPLNLRLQHAEMKSANGARFESSNNTKFVTSLESGMHVCLEW